MKRVVFLLATILLVGGCFTNSSEENIGGRQEPVVSPINISEQQQENNSLYLEDTEHWWEVF